MRRLRAASWLAALLLAPAAARAQDAPVRPPERRPAKPLQPLVCESLDQALERAAAREQVALVAVGLGAEGEVPRLFLDAGVARASRLILTLAAVEHAPEGEFFRSRKLAADATPRVLVLDPRGNVLESHPDPVEPAILLAGARAARTLYLKTQEALPAVAARAEELAAARDEKGLLTLARPWLARHYRGYPELDRLRALVTDSGKARLQAVAPEDPAQALRDLDALAAEYAHSPVEALAALRMASLQEEKFRNRDEAKKLVRRVLDDLPWPENAEAHEQARAVLGRFRQEDIRRRLDEIEKKKKEEEK